MAARARARYTVLMVFAIAAGFATPAVARQPTAADICSRIPKAVAPKDVPGEVKDWAGSGPVIGNRAIWTVRDAIPKPEDPSSWWTPDEDGGYGLKFPWYLRPERGDTPMIKGRRVDGPGTFTAAANSAISGGHTWVASGLRFSGAGCWKVVAKYKGSTLKFRIRVGPSTRD